MQLPQSIATDRLALGLSQQELAERLGVTQQSVSKWEEGLARPRGKRLDKLVATLGKKSYTAEAVARILIHTYSDQETNKMHVGNPQLNQAQALAALATAAQEIAMAAKALAESVAHICQQQTPKPPSQH